MTPAPRGAGGAEAWGLAAAAHGWGGTAADDFTSAFGLQALLENDANLAALGEHIWGAGRGRNSSWS